MGKITAIILLFTFTLVQYSRYINFMECKVVNYFATTPATCDCEKILQKNILGDKPALPVTHIHNYTDTLYYPASVLTELYSLNDIHSFNSQHAILLNDGCYGHIDHPPPPAITIHQFM